MSWLDPSTPLKVGDAGQLAGTRCRVTGWARLRTRTGTVYWWHEYRLLGDDGRERLLVHEVEDGDPVWRLFTAQPPDPALDRLRASSLAVGSLLRYQGTGYTVEFLGASLVHETGGDAPAGYVRGQEDSYFNAKNGDAMLVGSWGAGPDVALYKGKTLHRGQVEKAFGLPPPPAPGTTPDVDESWDTSWSGTATLLRILWVVVFGIFLVARSLPEGPDTVYIAPPPPENAPAPRGRPDLTFSFRGLTYHLAGHRLVEMRRPERWRAAHVYWLENHRRERILLLQHFVEAKDTWWIAIPRPDDDAPTATVAALLRRGVTTVRGGEIYRAQDTFQLQTRFSEGAAPLPVVTGTTFTQGSYLKGETNHRLALWSDQGLEWFELTPLDPTAVQTWPSSPSPQLGL